LKLRKFLSDFVNYQANQFRKSNEQSDHPHHQAPVHASLDPSEGNVSKPLGWLGGDTKIPELKAKASTSPSNRFHLCEIDCSQLPAEVWGSLGPRSGSLVFFLTLDSKIRAEAVLIDDPSAPTPVPAHSRENVSSYYLEQSRYPEFMPALPSWPIRQNVSQQDAVDSDENAPKYARNLFSDLSLADPCLKPHTLDQLKLLVEVAYRQLRDMHEEEAARFENARGAEDEIADRKSTVAKQIAEYERLITYFSERYSKETFTELSWVNAYDELTLLFKLAVDEELFRSEPLIRVLGMQDCLSLADASYSFSDSEDTREKCAKFKELTLRTIRAIEEQFNDVPVTKQGCINYAGYRKYRADHPEEWEAAARKVRLVQEEYTRLCFDLFEGALKRYNAEGYSSNALSICHHVAKGKPPSSLEDTLENLTKHLEIARKRLTELDDVTERSAKLAEIQSTVDGLKDSLERTTELKKQLEDATTQDFLQGAWTDVPSWMDGLVESKMLSRGHFKDYVTIRNLMMQQIYKEAPNNIDPKTRNLLFEQWQEQSRVEPIQIGGKPNGWCHTFIENLPKSVMLIQIPSGLLSGFLFGDAHNLVISIDRKRLAKNDFSRLWVDISN